MSGMNVHGVSFPVVTESGVWVAVVWTPSLKSSRLRWMRRRLASPSGRVHEHFFHDVASGELGLKTTQGVEVTARLTVRMIGKIKARLVTMRALRPAYAGPRRDRCAISERRGQLDCKGILCVREYWYATATQRNSHVLTIKSSWVWPAVRMSESACKK